MNDYKTFTAENINFMCLTNVLNACWSAIQNNNELGLVIYFAEGHALEVTVNNQKLEAGYGDEDWNGCYRVNEDGEITDDRTYQNLDYLYDFVRNYIEDKTIEEMSLCYAF